MWRPGCLSSVSCWECPCGQTPHHLCPGFPGVSSWHSSPFPGPSSRRQQGLGTGGTAASGAQVLPTALPAPSRRDRRQRGPVLFKVEIKGLYKLGGVPLVFPCRLAAGALAMGAHTAHPAGVTHPEPRERGGGWGGGRTCSDPSQPSRSSRKVTKAEATGLARVSPL